LFAAERNHRLGLFQDDVLLPAQLMEKGRRHEGKPQAWKMSQALGLTECLLIPLPGLLWIAKKPQTLG
jgi:hypothetical protein